MKQRARRLAPGIGFVTWAITCVALLGCDVLDIEKIQEMVDSVRPPKAQEPARQPAEPRPSLDERVRAEILASANGSQQAESRASAVSEGGERTMDSISPGDSIRVYYQFVDTRGRVRFVERLSDVPVEWRDRVGFVEMDTPPPMTPADARKTWQADPNAIRRTPTRLAAAGSSSRRADLGLDIDSDIILYSADWCGYCKMAKRHLDDAGVAYDERDVDRRSIARELKEKTGRGGVPVLDVEGRILRGYSKAAYDQLLREL